MPTSESEPPPDDVVVEISPFREYGGWMDVGVGTRRDDAAVVAPWLNRVLTIADDQRVQELAAQIEERRIALDKDSGFERKYHRVTKLYFGGMAHHLSSLKSSLIATDPACAKCRFFVMTSWQRRRR